MSICSCKIQVFFSVTAFLNSPTPDTGDTIQLGFDFPTTAPLPPALYIPQSYTELSKVIFAELKVGSGMQSMRSLGIMVTGTPGVGKSCFVPFLMIYLVSKGFSVAVQYKLKFYHYCAETKCCTVVNLCNDGFDRTNYVNTVFLSDYNSFTSQFFEDLSYNVRAVFVSSPDPDKLQIIRSFRSRVKYFMPSWTSTELMECRRRIFSDTLNFEQCQQRMERWGGIPRVVLSDERTYKTINKELSDSLKDPSIVKKLIDRCDTSCTLFDDEYARRVQWLTPMEVSADFQYAIYRFPSPSIMFEVWHEVTELPKQMSFREYLRKADSTSLLGNIYETTIRHRTFFPNADITLYLYKLAKTSIADFEASDSIKLRLSSNVKSFEKVTNIPESQDPTDMLYWPLSQTNESFDFIQPPYIFQITKSSID